MLRRLFRIFIALPLFLAVWAFANSIGVTAEINRVTGVKIPDAMTIPGMRQIVDIRAKAGDVGNQAKNKARQMAVKAVKREVRSRYGPEAAALIPNDLTLREAKNFDFGAFGETVKEKLPAVKVPSIPKVPVPGIPGKGDKEYVKAAKTLDTLAVKGRAPATGYDRANFGSEWSDAAGNFGWTENGCDTRNDVLARDLINEKTENCKVTSGTLPYENYTGKTNVKFIASGPYENTLDIEHIVALSNAWATGAQQISADKRAALANDPINLFAADPSSNRQKGDADFATWLPSNKAFRCDYAVMQIRVKAKYGLWVTPAEKSAMKKVLGSC